MIQTYEEVKNNTKTMEISMENYNRTVSSSTTTTTADNLNDVLRPKEVHFNNGDIKDSETKSTINSDIVDADNESTTTRTNLTTLVTTTNGNLTTSSTNVMCTGIVSGNGSSGGGGGGGGVVSVGSGATGVGVVSDSTTSLDNNKNSELNNCKINEVTIQRPLKPQSEMDFLVPYNIINNYFSVGVVSIIYFFIFIYLRDLIKGKMVLTKGYNQLLCIVQQRHLFTNSFLC